MSTPSPANPQSQSLVTRLPREIRDQIYLDLWQSPGHGLRQHIFLYMSADGRKERLCRRPCTRPEFDERALEMSRYFGHSHWDCAAEAERKRISKNARPNGRTRARTSWLPMLLVCKGISAEVLESIYESTTFIFADIVAFVKFPASPLDQISQKSRHLLVNGVRVSYAGRSRSEHGRPDSAFMLAISKPNTKQIKPN